MTSGIGSAVTSKVVQRLAALTQIGTDAADPVDVDQVRRQNVSADIAERSGGVKYPNVNVYCEGIANQLIEKFRTFSGKVQMAIEVRHSQDRLEGLQDKLEVYVEGAMNVLNTSRGDWGDGMFYGGAYQVSLGPVKQGGKNFMQIAKITFEIGVSRD